MPRRCGHTKEKYTQFTVGSPGPIWHCRGPPNHDNDTEDVARGQQMFKPCTHRVCKAECLLLGLKCRAGAAKPSQDTRNPDLALQGLFGTAEGRQTMTTTPETSLEVNAGSLRACTACAKQRFHSLALKAASVRSNQGETRAIHTWFSRPIWYCRGPQKHDNDTGVVARGQRWFTPCMHCVHNAEFLLLGPQCPVSAVEPRQNTRNP